MMAEPFIGEIRPFAFGVIPNGWIPCNGQVLPISGNQALYSLLGPVYGGDGKTTFAVPNLQGRVPLHRGSTIGYGTMGGEAEHILTINEIPSHSHQIYADSGTANLSTPQNNAWGSMSSKSIYAQNVNATMNTAALSTTGQSKAHNNMQPYLAVSFCIATMGIFPPRG